MEQTHPNLEDLHLPNKPTTYLIKRSNIFRDLKKSNSKKKGYFEIIITNKNKAPESSEINKGDIIYVAETSGGIYAKGKVIASSGVKELTSVSELLQFSKKFNDDPYWLYKIREFDKMLAIDSTYKLKFHEYFVNQKLLTRTIPYNGPLKRFDASENKGLARIFFKLKETEDSYLNNPKEIEYQLKSVHELKKEIPGDLRLRVHSFFNQYSSIGHLVDIDHFVPKSAGGPGNIIENLVPVGFSLNRYKSDLIPRSFFEVALSDHFRNNFQSFEKRIISALKADKLFLSKKDVPGLIDLACSLNEEVANWDDFEYIRLFYLEVNKSFNPDFVELIKNFK